MLALLPNTIDLPSGEAPSARVQRIHLVGALGAGMQALVEVLLGQGARLSGSDMQAAGVASPRYRILARHAAEAITADLDLVVYSEAVAADNVELRQARKLGIPTLSFPAMLGRLMQDRLGLAIAGTHGKSTATAMAAEILASAGYDPTVIGGGAPLGHASGGRYGRGEVFLAEACEYRSHFLQLAPKIAVVLGVELDHLDCFASLEQVEAAFGKFVAKLPADGFALLSADCPAARRLASRLACPWETFGIAARCDETIRQASRQPDWLAAPIHEKHGRYEFEIRHRDRSLGQVRLRVPGLHNVKNALAAAALSVRCGVSAGDALRGLAQFAGIHRRLETLGQWQGIAVVDDYAHHPTEVAASLAAVRRMFPRRPIRCVFQPHQVSRTAALLDEFARSLHNADYLYVADIFRAREPERVHGEVTAADLARLAAAWGTRVAGAHAVAAIRAQILADARPGEVLVIVGAGDIGKLAHDIVERLRENRQAG